MNAAGNEAVECIIPGPASSDGSPAYLRRLCRPAAASMLIAGRGAGEMTMGRERDANTPAENSGASLTRRSLFQRAGLAIAAAALPAGSPMAGQSEAAATAEKSASPAASSQGISL